MPDGPHSTARVSVRFFTAAFAAEEWANPGPPVHAYDAPTLRMQPGRRSAIARRASSRLMKKVPSATMPVTARHPPGDRSSAGTGKLPAALLTHTSTGPSSDVTSS